MCNKSIPELTAPAGSREMLEAAVRAGADAVYFGTHAFNARIRAENFKTEDISEVTGYCHARNVKAYLTLNTLIKDSEMEAAVKTAAIAYESGIDAVIVQDLGFARVLAAEFKEMRLHASTQMTVFDKKGCDKLKALGFSRVVLARELSLDKIAYICHNADIECEIFVHGSLCASYSGQCLFSSLAGGRSGNRGECAQPCRKRYSLIDDNNRQIGKEGYLLSTKDLITLGMIDRIKSTGVAALKIEGRLKDKYYAAMATGAYRRAIDGTGNISADTENLKQIFLRGGGTTGHIGGGSIRNTETSGHRGIFLGTVLHKRNDKLYLKTEKPVSIGDSIIIAASTGDRSYQASKIEVDDRLVATVPAGRLAGIGHFKYDVEPGSRLYIKSDISILKELEQLILKTEKIIPIKGVFTARIGDNPVLSVSEGEISLSLTDYQHNVVKAEKTSTTKEDIQNSLLKTGNTPYGFTDLKIYIDEGIYLPLAVINAMRREILSLLEAAKQRRRKPVDYSLTKHRPDSAPAIINKLYTLYIEKPSEYDYSLIDTFEYIYLPIEHFLQRKEFARPDKVVFFLPLIDNDEGFYSTLIEQVLRSGFRRFLIKTIAQTAYFRDHSCVIHADSSLNIFNSFSSEGLSPEINGPICISSELAASDIREIHTGRELEIIGYGSMRIMSVGHSLSPGGSGYSLSDSEKGRKYRLLNDNRNGIVTVYNCDILSIAGRLDEIKNTRVKYIRLMFIEGDPQFIASETEAFTSGRLTAKNMTFGHYLGKGEKE